MSCAEFKRLLLLLLSVLTLHAVTILDDYLAFSKMSGVGLQTCGVARKDDWTSFRRNMEGFMHSILRPDTDDLAAESHSKDFNPISRAIPPPSGATNMSSCPGVQQENMQQGHDVASLDIRRSEYDLCKATARPRQPRPSIRYGREPIAIRCIHYPA